MLALEGVACTRSAITAAMTERGDHSGDDGRRLSHLISGPAGRSARLGRTQRRLRGGRVLFLRSHNIRCSSLRSLPGKNTQKSFQVTRFLVFQKVLVLNTKNYVYNNIGCTLTKVMVSASI